MPRKSGAIPILLIGFIPFLLLGHAAQAGASSGNAAKGKQTFDSICSACHTIGGGIKVGPDLKGITDQRSTTWLAHFISNPDKMIKSGDPIASSLLKKFNNLEMPNFGLSAEKVSDVLAYLESTTAPVKTQAPAEKASAASAARTPPPAQAPMPGPAPQPAQKPGPSAQALAGASSAGSAETGEKLFTGLFPFQKGGPPCISCHDVARLPFPGGGTLGPDLTGAFAKFGATSMNSVLASLPFPTMRPIFDQRPLSVQEQQDLEAFLQKPGVESLISRGVEIGLSGLGGLIILVILAWIIWQNRLAPVRELEGKPKWE
jgi:mono/diheme cytochrome c family protein